LQALGLVTAALLVIYGYGLVTVRSLEAEVAQLATREQALTMQLARIDPELGRGQREQIERELGRLSSKLLEQQQLVEVLREQPLGSAEGFSGYLAAIGRQREPALWLTGIAINGSTGAIELAGRSLAPERVPEFMQRLGREPVLAGQRFDQFEIERDEETGEAMFRATSRAVAVDLAADDERSLR
jgi:MSHA biogenesis protein MshI